MTSNQNVKDVITLLSKLASAEQTIMADGKVSWPEIAGQLPLLLEIPAILPKFSLAKDELLNADNESKADIVKFAETSLSLANPKTENLIENLIGVLTYGVAIIGSLKSTPAPVALPSA